jgi:GNAT superfamily N-acetyltransferase
MVAISYKQIDNILSHGPLFDQIAELDEKIFGTSQLAEGAVVTKHKLIAFVAFADEKIIGYKIGHERKPKHFYSWLGGVDPDFRGQGIAKELMQRQHAWCKDHGYIAIRTQTKNKWRSMLLLNIKAGFDIIGTYIDDHKDIKIMLEKYL